MLAYWLRICHSWRIALMVVVGVFLVGGLIYWWYAWMDSPDHYTTVSLHSSDNITPSQQFTSVVGRPIDVYVFGRGPRTVLVLAGMHGDEPASVTLACALIHHLQALPESAIPQRVVVIPVVNPDGLVAHTRRNAHQIDLNRNFPTQDFDAGVHTGRYNGGRTAGSEPETQAIMHITEYYKPALIISLHAPLGCINYDGPAGNIARRMARLDHFPVAEQLPNPSPGSLGAYYGKERGLPVITLELTPGQRQWARHGRALLDAIGMTTREE
ncbi:MAG TPA: M14 family zinc carboxypeptidase [Armatimonadota bacterium]|nr:M14 family zinc carboxypeptidase [Armatimonadota bacterium]